MLSTALVAGGLLAFALSFDEVVVTYFTAGAQNTLPLLILGYIRLGQQLPVVNAIAFAMILLTVIPVALAQRLMRDTGVSLGGTAKSRRDEHERNEDGIPGFVGGELGRQRVRRDDGGDRARAPAR